MGQLYVCWKTDPISKIAVVFNLMLALLVSGCGFFRMETTFRSIGSSVALKVEGDPTSLSIAEGSSVALVPTLTGTMSTDVHVTATLAKSTSSGSYTVAGSFVESMPVAVTIPAGQTSAAITLTSIADPVYTGDYDFTITIAASEISGANVINLKLIDQQPLTLGAFSINGVIDQAEVSDTTYDAELADALTPKFSWSASSFATSYEASLLADDGATVVCPAQVVTSLSASFSVSTCQLNVEGYYKAKVVAKAGTVELPASLYRFRVTSSAILVSDTIMLLNSGSAVTFDPRVNDANPTAPITAVGTASAGSASFTGSSVTYTPDSSATGPQTFSYTTTIAGNPTSGTVRVKLMTPYTWTGAVSNDFATAGNWCGSVSNPGPSGVCAGSSTVPGASNVAVVDLTCSSANCSPVIANASAVSLQGVKLAGNTLTKTGSATLAVGSSGFVQTAGVFVGGSGNMTVEGGPLTLSAGAFTAPSGTLKSKANVATIASGVTFNHSSGTVLFASDWNSQIDIVPNSAVFNNVTFSDGGDIHAYITGKMIVDGNYRLEDTNYGDVVGEFAVKGNVYTAATGLYGGGVIELVGNPAGQTVSSSGATAKLQGLKIAAGTNNVTLSGAIHTLGGSYNVESVGALTTTGSTLIIGDTGCGNAVTVHPGNINYNNVTFKSGCHLINMGGATFKVAGDLAFDNGFDDEINNGVIDVLGNVDGSLGGFVKGTASVKLSGRASGQTITSNSAFGLPNLEIAAGVHNVTMNNVINSFYSFKVTSVGTLVAPPKLILDGQCNGFGYAGKFKGVFGTTHFNDVSLVGGCPYFDFDGEQLYVDGKLTLGGDYANGLDNLTIHAKGDVEVSNSYRGSGVVRLTGNASGQKISATGDDSFIPNLVIAAGANAVTIDGSKKLQIVTSFENVSAGSFTQVSALQIGIEECSGDTSVRSNGLAFGHLLVNTWCKKVNFLDSLRVNNGLEVAQLGDDSSMNMPNPGTGYTVDIYGGYSNAAVPFNLYGAVMTIH